jgi:excisionase family DNA binding protein
MTGPVRMYSVTDTAEILGTSTNYVRARIKDGTLPFVELGGGKSKRRIRADHLEKFIQARTIAAKTRRTA